MEKSINTCITTIEKSINTRIDNLSNRVESIHNRVDSIHNRVESIGNLAAKSRNLLIEDGGHGLQFEIISFVVTKQNGEIDYEDPTKHPHNLPPIHSLKHLEGLTAENLDKYHRGYFPGQNIRPLPLKTKISNVVMAIGAPKMIDDR